MTPHEICGGCGQEIDADCCGCGSVKAEHTGYEGHPFIPAGCDCHRSARYSAEVKYDTCFSCNQKVRWELLDAPNRYAPVEHNAACGTACFGGGVSDAVYRSHAVHGSRAFPCPKGCPTSALLAYLVLYKETKGGGRDDSVLERLTALYEKMSRDEQKSVVAHRIAAVHGPDFP